MDTPFFGNFDRLLLVAASPFLGWLFQDWREKRQSNPVAIVREIGTREDSAFIARFRAVAIAEGKKFDIPASFLMANGLLKREKLTNWKKWRAESKRLIQDGWEFNQAIFSKTETYQLQTLDK